MSTSKYISVVAASCVFAAAGWAQPAPVAHWTMDNTFVDATGNGVNLIENGTVPFVTGQVGQAADFNDNGDNFLNNANPALDPGTGDFAVSFWFNVDDETKNQSLLGKGVEAFGFPDEGYRVRLDGSKLQFRLLDNGDNNAEVAAPAANAWHHVVAQRDGDEIELFLNGLEVANDVGNASIDLTTSRAFTIGRRTAQSGSGAMAGAIDEVWYFDEALSDSVVTSLFTQNVVPEPATAGALLLGGLAMLRRRSAR
jgi:hypothetical protein